MRVLDIITESVHPLQTLRTGTGPTNPLSQFNYRDNQVTALKQELARHVLVTGVDPRTGQQTLGGKAWTGPIDAEWTPALNNAISAWKRSINYQLSGTPDSPLQNIGNPTISYNDLDELLTTKLGNNGLLMVQSNGNLERRSVPAAGAAAGETYRIGHIVGTVDNVTDINSMLEQAGFSVWFRIAAEILESRRSRPGESWLKTTPRAERSQAITTKLDAFYRNRNTFPDNWVTEVNRAAQNASAVYADNTTQSIAYKEKIAPTAKELFTYYTDMAKRLWEKDQAQNRDEQETADEVNANPVNAVTLDNNELRTMAAQLNNAFKNNLTAILPGGRSFYNDIEAIEYIISRLRTATDFDNFSTVYAEVNGGNVLHEELYKELDEEDYQRIVEGRLLAIRRIAPKILHSNINFGDAEEIRVRYNNKNYDIQREKDSNNNPVIQGYENDYNVIIIDDILRLGVEQSGGTVPDLNTPPDDESINAAQLFFINTIQQTYPEMVAFYVRAEPFDGASADLGGMRMRGIIQNAARMGNDEVSVRSFITNEIANDREWLVGTSDGSVEPAANIRFDERYQSEGLSNREFESVSADAEVSLNANEEEIYENLKSPQEAVRKQAIDDLLQNNNREKMWENIYRRAASSGEYFDDSQTLGGGEEVIKGFLINNTDDNSLILRVVRELGAPLAAPYVTAKLFDNAIRAGLLGGTDEDTIDLLIAQIKDRNDYELIDERYVKLPKTDDSLIDDLAGEQFAGIFGYGWYGKLAEIIGDDRRLDMIRVELNREIRDAVEDVERSATQETIDNLKRRINNREFRSNKDQLDLVIDRLSEVVDDLNSSADQQPIAVAVNEIVEELQELYDNL